MSSDSKQNERQTLAGAASQAIDSGLWFIAAIVVLLLCAIYLYVNVFAQYGMLDDEGSLMRTHQSFLEGRRLYTDIFTLYGPTPYLIKNLLLRVFAQGHLTHDLNRTISMAYGLLTVIILAATTLRISKSRFVALITMIATTAEIVVPIRTEPGHPQDLTMLIIASIMFVATFQKRERQRNALIGILVAALMLTKINAGVFVFAGVFVCFAATHSRGALSRAGWYVAGFALLAVAPALLRTEIMNPANWSFFQPKMIIIFPSSSWIRLAGAVLCAQIAWLLLAQLNLNRISPAQSATFLRASASWLIPFVAAAFGIIIWIGFYGTSPAALFDGMVLRPLALPTVLKEGINITTSQAVQGAAAVGVLLVAIGRNQSWHTVQAQRIVSLIQIAAGLSFILPRITFGLGSMTFAGPNPQDSTFAMPFGWMLLFPCTPGNGNKTTQQPAFPLYVISLVSVIFTLYQFPVAGSQISVVAVFAAIVSILLVADGASRMRTTFPADEAARTVTPSRVMAIGQIVLVGTFLLGTYYARAAEGSIKRFLEGIPARQLDGSKQTRLDRTAYNRFALLVSNVRAYTDDYITISGANYVGGFSGYPSLHFWSGQPPANQWCENFSSYMFMHPDEQEKILQSLDTGPRTGLLAPAEFDLPEPAKSYLMSTFKPALTLMELNLYLKPDQIRDVMPLWLIYGKYSFAEFDDQLPLPDTLILDRLPCTLAMWFSTSKPGVLFGAQTGLVRERQWTVTANKGRPGIYIGLDGHLRVAINGMSESADALQSPTRVDDGDWHQIVVCISADQHSVFLDNQPIGTLYGATRLKFVPQSQLGGGAWTGFPSTDDAPWTPFRGSIENAVLIPGLVKPGELRQILAAFTRK